MAVAGLAFASVPLAAQLTTAGTIIESTAEATYTDAGITRSVASNPVEVRVDELLSVAFASQDSGVVSISPGLATLGFLLTNTGNGPEQFVIEAAPALSDSGAGVVLEGVAVDGNGNGAYDPGIDAVLPVPATTESLPADASQTVFAVLTVPPGLAEDAIIDVGLVARAATGSGAPGTTFAGAGTGGSNAVVGVSGAAAVSSGQLAASASSVTLVKWASVADPFGGSAVVPGAVVTYSIRTLVSGSADIDGLVVNDAIPASTTYRPNSLRRDGAVLTDAAGDDAGEASAAGITVNLDRLAAGASSTVSFAVLVNDEG